MQLRRLQRRCNRLCLLVFLVLDSYQESTNRAPRPLGGHIRADFLPSNNTPDPAKGEELPAARPMRALRHWDICPQTSDSRANPDLHVSAGELSPIARSCTGPGCRARGGPFCSLHTI